MRRLAAILCLLAACGDEGGERQASPDAGLPARDPLPKDEDRVLCDGSQQLRLFTRIDGWGDLYSEGTLFLYDNGFEVLQVRGDCRYFVLSFDTTSSYTELREGVLSQDGEAALVDALAFKSWPYMARSWNPDPGHEGWSHLVLQDGENEVVCVFGCEGPETPAELLELDSTYAELVRGLWNDAEPGPGNVRIKAVRRESPSSEYEPLVGWPLDVPLQAVVMEPEVDADSTPSTVVAEPDATVLRAARRAFVQEYAGTWSMGSLPIADAPRNPVQIFQRDVLPFEDDAGLVSFAEP